MWKTLPSFPLAWDGKFPFAKKNTVGLSYRQSGLYRMSEFKGIAPGRWICCSDLDCLAGWQLLMLAHSLNITE